MGGGGSTRVTGYIIMHYAVVCTSRLHGFSTSILLRGLLQDTYRQLLCT